MLEAVTLGERAEILIALTEMVLAQLSQSGGSNDNSVQ
jgi:Lon protease-like protein